MTRKLQEAMYQSHREWAAEELGKCDWRTQPEVLNTLMSAARSDPAPMVRACCVKSLARMKANTLPVVQTVQALKNDSDPRVRAEVERALAVLARP